MAENTGKRGRPAGVARPHKVNTYLDDQELRLLKELAQVQDRSEAAVLREALRQLAKKEGIK